MGDAKAPFETAASPTGANEADLGRRVASNPDDRSAPLADRLLLALGMWPRYIEELGDDALVDAAAAIRTLAHREPMVAEDWSRARSAEDAAVQALEEDGPRLGLATTRQLLDELTTRIEMDGYVGGGGLDYRTVDDR